MIPHLDALLELNRRGEMPMGEIVSHIVKMVALHGEKSDFDGLPLSLKSEVFKTLDWYRSGGGWLEVSNNGMEDYAPYADAFIKKVGYPGA